MSQNNFTTSSVAGPVRVRAGWDAPLQELFCSVERLEGADEAGELPECFFRTSYANVKEMVECLAGAHIALPAGFIQAVSHDVESRSGNVLRDFDVTPPTRSV